MEIYYKFKSAKYYDSIPIESHFISVGNLKERIFESKNLGSGTDFDLVVINAQTKEEYVDEATLIHKNTSVLIRRVPGLARMPIVIEPIKQEKLEMGNGELDNQIGKSSKSAGNSNLLEADSSIMKHMGDSELDEFGKDVYAVSAILSVSNTSQDLMPPSKHGEDRKIRALVKTPALNWQGLSSDDFGTGRGFGRGWGGLKRKIPPQDYVCYRCKLPGHFIQHCPANGDPSYNIKRAKLPTDIRRSMSMTTPDSSYASSNEPVVSMKPNEVAFEKGTKRSHSTRSVGYLPPELHCPLCKQVMKDAVLAKCCFSSFCDKCIRDQIISKSICVCGATNILADYVCPNKTLRDTINRMLETGNSNVENAGSAFQVQDRESRISQTKMEPKVASSAPTVDCRLKLKRSQSPHVVHLRTSMVVGL